MSEVAYVSEILAPARCLGLIFPPTSEISSFAIIVLKKHNVYLRGILNSTLSESIDPAVLSCSFFSGLGPVRLGALWPWAWDGPQHNTPSTTIIAGNLLFLEFYDTRHNVWSTRLALCYAQRPHCPQARFCSHHLLRLCLSPYRSTPHTPSVYHGSHILYCRLFIFVHRLLAVLGWRG